MIMVGDRKRNWAERYGARSKEIKQTKEGAKGGKNSWTSLVIKSNCK